MKVYERYDRNRKNENLKNVRKVRPLQKVGFIMMIVAIIIIRIDNIIEGIDQKLMIKLGLGYPGEHILEYLWIHVPWDLIGTPLFIAAAIVWLRGSKKEAEVIEK